MQLVSFDVAKYLHDKSIIIDSKYAYCISRIGVRVVIGDLNNPTAEYTYHNKTLEPVNPDKGIYYPSENWCSAPTVFDVLKYFYEKLGILILPEYKGNGLFGYNIIHNDTIISTSDTTYRTLHDVYIAALENFIIYKNKDYLN